MFFVVVLLLVGVTGGDPEPTTTKTYDIEVPGSDPIRIIEGEPLWRTSKLEERAFKNQKDRLYQFLTSHNNKNKDEYELETVTKPDEEVDQKRGYSGESEKPKRWDLMEHHKHNHPYDDKKGWVSMEPVPWSVSKISKWQSNHKPTSKPWENDYDEVYAKPSTWNKPTNYDVFYLDNQQDSKPIYVKPSATYGQKVQVDYNKKYQHKHDENCEHEGEIITDGRPPDFPQSYEANRRKGTEVYPDNHPLSDGEGEWVLLSTTKGYKFPQQRQRALQINPDSMGAHRGVRLTVLPPLKNSKVNMTTSHGGLLQVESTFQTVEQSRKQLNKIKKAKLKRKRPQKRPIRQQQQIFTPAVTTNRNAGPDSSTVLAAVGAGMIPATMAMLVPMALGGRRKREVGHVTGPPTLQITLPRNL